jgi:bifunctional ADP-heptose synthase (sugar kinase/adenylyltransferase)
VGGAHKIAKRDCRAPADAFASSAMTPDRLDALLARFHTLRLGVVGDFSLDRYFDIDPARAEVSIETGRPVHNVTRVRCQPGAAGNIAQNLAAFAPAALHPVGYCGDDGEGFELRRALLRLGGVSLEHFQTTPARLTFTYSKPLVHAPARRPRNSRAST